jgi:hypothetical protein
MFTFLNKTWSSTPLITVPYKSEYNDWIIWVPTLGGTCCSSFQVSLLQCVFFSLSLSSPVSIALDCLFLIALSIYSNVYCHSHFIPIFCLFPCQLLIVYTWLHFRLSLTFIAIDISTPPPFFVFVRVNSWFFILDYPFDYLWRLLP